MADRRKATPVFFGVVITAIAALIAYGMVRAWKSSGTSGNPASQAAKEGGSPDLGGPKDAGEKILEGADRAFRANYFETALKFYRDYDLRYAGTEAYEKNAERVWDRMRASNNALEKRDETLTATIGARKALHEAWKKLAVPPRKEQDLRSFLELLPLGDGRRPKVEAWLAAGGSEK